ncbi:DUF6318 family protein [Kineococcus indalonis]|uniref:DUF6318 family protein n=1 Tax=Kineococcus indalonis TaxID=2696566 RepID=UPI0014123527|nr:DUF6318 family protein [Kineococcus indalonis]NAZ85954.1 DEDDh family exonuclease [Kineococcus indalonis]
MTSLFPGPVLPQDDGATASFGARYPHRYAVLDVETTGFSAGRDRVVQVAVALVDEHGEVESTWATLVDPERDPGPVHVHGITAERLRGAPLFADVAVELAALLAGRVFVAHNAVFDWGFVAAEMRRAGVALQVEQRLCTRNLAKRLDLPVPDLKLATLAAHWEVRQLRAHDAEDDTRVLVEVLRHALRAAADYDLDLPLTRCSSEPPPPRPRTPRGAGAPAEAVVGAVLAPAARPTFTAVGFDEDDAIAFAAHYLKVLNHARATGDSDAIREISEPDCGACQEDAKVIDAAHARGLVWENNLSSFRSAYIEHFDPSSGQAEVQLHMYAEAGRVVNPDGSTLKSTEAMEFDGLMQLKFHDSRWFVWEMPR